MNLKNGYKVMYEVIGDDSRVIKASKNGCFEGAEEIATLTTKYEVVYQRGTEIIGKLANGTEEKIDLDKVLVEAKVEEEVEPTNVAPASVEPEVPAEEIPEELPEDEEV